MPTARKFSEQSQVRSASICVQPTGRAGTKRPRVFILSNVRLHCEGVAISLSRTDEVDIVGAAGPPEAFARIAETRPDVVLVDAASVEFLSLARIRHELAPDVKAVAFAVSGADQDVIACAEAGISAYVSREGSIEDLIKAINQAMRGELVVSPRLTALLFDRVAALSERRASGNGMLTQREKEIIPLIEQGLSNKEIARQLCIGNGTIKHHIHNILEKLQVRRRGEIAARIRRDRLQAGATIA